jgi:hypothetical protein
MKVPGRSQKGRKPRKPFHRSASARAAAQIYVTWPDTGLAAPLDGQPEPRTQGHHHRQQPHDRRVGERG